MQPKYTFLFRLFSRLNTVLALCLLVIVSAALCCDNWIETFFLSFLPVSFIAAKWEIVMLVVLPGHGVVPTFKIAGFPVKIIVWAIIIVSICCFLWYNSYKFNQKFPGDHMRMTMLTTGVILSTVIMFLRWRFRLFYELWTLSEVDFRAQMASYPSAFVEQRVQYLRTEGLLDTGKPIPNLE